jgi:hypothetical protein
LSLRALKLHLVIPMLSVPAHYDGQYIRLDEPMELPIGRRPLVTALDEVDGADDFYHLAAGGLTSAFGPSEPEYRGRSSSMKEGAILLAHIQQADGQSKLRPVLVLRSMPPNGDWLVCGISSQLHQEAARFDQVITASDADFLSSGLKISSVLRLG